ncbi:hypothetical protein [Luteolibacter marinus]|uniref:hypothetical protein n=1 Tax=Luteolibacter marinus TaxID=2776705 RepID=UPI001868940D|nr:hypothetical protein [Luteolibacter marinus]
MKITGWLPVLALLVILAAKARAFDWTTWESPFEGATGSEMHFVEDGRLLLLYLEHGPSAPSRTLMLATYDRGSIISVPVDVVGPTDRSSDAHQFRLVGHGPDCWAVWRTEASDGSNSLRAARVAPGGSSFAIETVAGSDTGYDFDAYVAEDGFPRVFHTVLNASSASISRRRSDGNWETAPVLATPPNTYISDLALTGHGGTTLEAIACSVENLTASGTGSGYRSILDHYRAVEPSDWSTLSLTWGGQLWENETYPQNRSIATNLRTRWTPDGILAATYSRWLDGTAVLALLDSGYLERQKYYFGAAGTTAAGTNLACGDQGRIFVTYDTSGGPAYRIWQDGSFSATEVVEELTIQAFALETDVHGFPWIGGVQTSLVASPTLQFGTPELNTDVDGDGLIGFLEEAFHSNPLVYDPQNHPIIGTDEFGGQTYLTVAYLGDSGGTGENPYTTSQYIYAVEVSPDLDEWSSDPADVVHEDRFTISGRGTVNVVRSALPLGSLAGQYIRVRVVAR